MNGKKEPQMFSSNVIWEAHIHNLYDTIIKTWNMYRICFKPDKNISTQEKPMRAFIIKRKQMQKY